jgi:hypothetical protein
MRKSEIFEAFAEKMKEQEKLDSNKTKELLEKNPRMSALTADDIEKLYNVKPDSPKEMHYKNNIMEYAHKGNVVVSPSYDKLNGLVENNIERQNILLHIVNKPTDGLNINRKYAEKELVLSLVSLGNHLDNVSKDDLRTLSDTCLTQVAGKTLEKKALAPLAWAALVGVPSLIGAIYAQQHLPNIDRGFRENHIKLVSELNDFVTSNSNFGVGTTYSQQFVNSVQNAVDKIEEFYAIYFKNQEIINKLETPKTAKELIQVASQPAGTEAVTAYNELLKSFANFLPLLNGMERNFKSENFKGRQVQEKGFISSLIDKTEVLHGPNGLVADDFQDVANAIPPYKKSVQEMLKVFAEAQNLQNKAKQDLETAATETAQITEPSKSVTDVDNEAEDLGKELEDLGKDYINMI